ncbi:MAG: hypothetical protein CMJ45_02205 [Planctomyces sp.]|nr:hypothetical protein [Planctomyces sp.]
MDRISVGPFITVLFRAAFGLMVGTFLAFAGFFAGWFSAPPGPAIPEPLLIIGTWLGASLGGFVAWLKPETARNVILVHLVLVLTGGLIGTLLGWELGSIIYPDGIEKPGGTIYTAPPFYVGILGAAVGANSLSMVYYSFRLWRFREV